MVPHFAALQESGCGTKETARLALPYDCFRPETGPAVDALGGRLVTQTGHRGPAFWVARKSETYLFSMEACSMALSCELPLFPAQECDYALSQVGPTGRSAAR